MKEVFYLMTHSTHFIYGFMASDISQRNIESERGNPLSPIDGLLFPISYFICIIHRQDSSYHGSY